MRIIKTPFKAIENDKISPEDIKHSLNANLVKLLNDRNLNSGRTIVATDGSGQYKTIEDAVDSGARYIFIKNGTYNINKDINLENQSLEGETKNGVILNITEATISYKEVINKTSVGTIQFFEDDKSVDGDNTAFLNLSTSTEFKYTWSEARDLRVASIQDSTHLELRSKYYGATTSPINGTLLQLDQFTFESRANYSSIKNMTINHIINNPLETIILNGVNITVENIKFFNSNNLSTFIKIAKNDTVISIRNKIINNNFEGGAIGILANKAYYTNIKGNYFTNIEDRCIELKNSSKYTKIINNVFSSGLFGVVQNALNVTYQNNTFKFMKNNAVSINSSSFTTNNTFTKILNCTFSRCTLDKSFTNDGALLIRGKGTVVKNCFFEEQKVGIQLNCSNTIIYNCVFNNTLFEYGIYTVGGKNYNSIISCDFYDNFMIQQRSGTEYTIIAKCANYGATPPTDFDGEKLLIINNTIEGEEFIVPGNCICYNNIFNDTEVYVKNKSIFMDNTVFTGLIASSGISSERLIVCNNNVNTPSNNIQNSADYSIICNNFVENETTPVSDSSTGSQVSNNYY